MYFLVGDQMWSAMLNACQTLDHWVPSVPLITLEGLVCTGGCPSDLAVPVIRLALSMSSETICQWWNRGFRIGSLCRLPCSCFTPVSIGNCWPHCRLSAFGAPPMTQHLRETDPKWRKKNWTNWTWGMWARGTWNNQRLKQVMTLSLLDCDLNFAGTQYEHRRNQLCTPVRTPSSFIEFDASLMETS